jgi:putative SOS response-associated peptidase YedK
LCNSISMVADAEDLTRQFQIDNVLSYFTNRHEIMPTESVSAIIVKDDKRQLDEFRWGLMPFWARDSVLLDSRSFEDKRVYERIIKKQRCIIPCSGFYVTRTEKKHTQWIKITMATGTFGIAGLYDVWRSSFSGEELRTCTMITTKSNSVVAPYLESMPAILDKDEIDQWLQPELKDLFVLQRLLRPMDALRMRTFTLASPKDKWESDADLEVTQPELA